jgi:tetrahydromethanopterin S-methyltransferase subunit A
MLKVNPHSDYPPEEGRYLRGNDFSPVAVAIILNCEAEKIPREIESLVRAGVEAGAGLSGTVQTENIGFEKMICNIVANPNIRYMIIGGPESEGHLTGEALKALFQNGVDAKRRIIGTQAPHPILFNVTTELIERFRKQLTPIDVQFVDEPEVIRRAVWSCYQEDFVDFRGRLLRDPGAYPEPPLSGKLTWRVFQPWAEPEEESEREALRRQRELIEKLRARTKKPA